MDGFDDRRGVVGDENVGGMFAQLCFEVDDRAADELDEDVLDVVLHLGDALGGAIRPDRVETLFIDQQCVTQRDPARADTLDGAPEAC